MSNVLEKNSKIPLFWRKLADRKFRQKLSTQRSFEWCSMEKCKKHWHFQAHCNHGIEKLSFCSKRNLKRNFFRYIIAGRVPAAKNLKHFRLWSRRSTYTTGKIRLIVAENFRCNEMECREMSRIWKKRTQFDFYTLIGFVPSRLKKNMD